MMVGPCWAATGCAIGNWGGEAGGAGYGRLGLTLKKENELAGGSLGCGREGRRLARVGNGPRPAMDIKTPISIYKHIFPICKSF
jgi:hypothetical protein